MSLALGYPIVVKDLGGVYPLRISEIAHMGLDKYKEVLGNALFGREFIEHNEQLRSIAEDEELSDFGIVYLMCGLNQEFRNRYFESLEIFVRKKPSLDKDGFFYFGDKSEECVLHDGNYDEFRQVIKRQNMIESSSTIKPKNNKTKSLMERFKKIKENSPEKKKSGREGDLFAIVENVASLSTNVNFNEIENYTVYQLYTQFNLMMKKENFDQQFNMILQGADIKPSDFKHWSV